MTDHKQGRAATWFGELATGPKMFIILFFALLPLGAIATFASINSARTSRYSDQVEAQAVLAVASQRLASTLTRVGVTVRVTSGAVSGSDPAAAARACDNAAAQLTDNERDPVRFALYGPGNQLICRTRGFEPPPLPLLPPAGTTALVQVEPEERHVSLTLFTPDGAAQGQIELPASLLATIIRPPSVGFPYELELAGSGGTIPVYDALDEGLVHEQVMLTEELLGGRLELRLRAPAKTLTPGEILLILLPTLLWALAAVVGWIVVDRVLLRPLARVHKAITAYQPGDSGFRRPRAASPAREIAALGDAFEGVTHTVARHEADLEAAVERQTRLVREVHHRVKNNLQVVASLLNLHSRSSTSDDVAAAYASIQRRVDALAVVHRNHYAELEKTPGVALKALISELGASLRASLPAGAAKMQIRLALEPLYANQDVAVSVAFLVTEVVEYGMLCGASLVSIALEPEEAGRARLSFESESLGEGAACSPDVQDRFERIVTGLARQLRSAAERDPAEGRLSISIAIVGREQRSDAS